MNTLRPAQARLPDAVNSSRSPGSHGHSAAGLRCPGPVGTARSPWGQPEPRECAVALLWAGQAMGGAEGWAGLRCRQAMGWAGLRRGQGRRRRSLQAGGDVGGNLVGGAPGG